MPFVDKIQKMDTDTWLFHKPRQLTKPERKHSTQWHKEIGILRPVPYKDSGTKKLPPLAPGAPKEVHSQRDSGRTKGRKNPVYTRFTRDQHQRRDSVQKWMEIINTPRGLYNELSKTLSQPGKHQLERILNKFHKREGKMAIDMSTSIYEELSQVLNEQGDALAYQDYQQTRLARIVDERSDILEIEKGDKQHRKSEPLKSVDDFLGGPTNPYMFLAKKEKEADKGLNKGKKSKQKQQKEHPWGTPEELHMKLVVQDFAEWVFDFGGEFDNIDAHTLTCLFSGGYDTKPAMFMPVTVVPTSDLPPDLLDDNLLETPPWKASVPALGKSKTLKRDENNGSLHKPFRYGAWYMHPKTWRKMDLDEQLQDPNQLQEDDLSEADKRRQELNEELADLYIPGAFMEYLKWKNARVPTFLQEVAEIQVIKEREKRENEVENKTGDKERVGSSANVLSSNNSNKNKMNISNNSPSFKRHQHDNE